jgi:hypothetical protein
MIFKAVWCVSEPVEKLQPVVGQLSSATFERADYSSTRASTNIRARAENFMHRNEPLQILTEVELQSRSRPLPYEL